MSLISTRRFSNRRRVMAPIASRPLIATMAARSTATMGSIIRSSFRRRIRTRGSRIGVLSRRPGLSLRGGTGGNPPNFCRRRCYAADVADFMEIRQANGYLRPERGARVITRAAQIVDNCPDNLGPAIAILRFYGARLARSEEHTSELQYLMH